MDWDADHAMFVLAAYGVVAAVLIGVLVHALWRANTLKKTLAQLQLSDPGQKDS